MSYAEVAAKGPEQSAEEVRDVPTHTFFIPNKCALVGIRTNTLVRRKSTQGLRAPNVGGIYKDESESTASLVDVDSQHVTVVDSNFLDQDIKTTTQAERIEREESEENKKAKEERKAKAKAKAKASGICRNSDNPVYIGNAVLLSLVGAGLGFGAYRKHAQGKLSWELIGLWSGAVGAFGAVDYFVSKWFLQNKYPPK
ncbi:hypothetical protein P875_00086647 [Aspergillus parasiticus SU-1]|uniref:Uncharacterized protein n=1 Tax=Aspergillus parasiticus (strain ATCC 56775 / NRRL 5862 / SRRC 143 / SU-1) TaxID=1403190 RepID=A0A0F0I7A5_ASPPU|nr:hypothetical protein P875_00086647 [Aspergillus parasiticus SU-1]